MRIKMDWIKKIRTDIFHVYILMSKSVLFTSQLNKGSANYSSVLATIPVILLHKARKAF